MQLHRAVPDLTVPDLPAAVAFYRDDLDLPVVMDHGWIVTFGVPGGAQFSVLEADATADRNPALSLEVDDVDAAHAAAVAAGRPIVHPLTDEEWGVRRFFLLDPAGTVVNVLSHGGVTSAGA